MYHLIQATYVPSHFPTNYGTESRSQKSILTSSSLVRSLALSRHPLAGKVLCWQVSSIWTTLCSLSVGVDPLSHFSVANCFHYLNDFSFAAPSSSSNCLNALCDILVLCQAVEVPFLLHARWYLQGVPSSGGWWMQGCIDSTRRGHVAPIQTLQMAK